MQEEPPFIGDWYRQKKLGSGGFGVVTLWKNQKTQQLVAIKRCHPITTTTDAAFKITVERWDREVDYMTHRVKHENIVSGLTIKPDSFLTEMNRINPSPMPILVMEYCECGDLRQQLNANANTSGFGERETRDILRCLGAAISYLHTLKITHRDIKPENIVIKKDPTTGQTVYKLTDLGYAKPLDQKSIVASLVGTLEYIAPELCMTDRYTNSVDYWSLGVIAFEIVTGTRPFVPHLLLAQWINTVKRKSSADICITEDSNGKMIYAQHFPAEHQISSCLAARLEPWLQLALEWNSKQRGHTFKNTTSKTTTSPDGTNLNLPPILELRIFSMLDNILSQRILTVFCLHTYTNLSYEINDATSMATLKALISKDTGIAVDRIRFVLHIAHPSPHDKVDDRPEAKPMEMFWPDQDTPRPMCYVYSVGDGMKKLDPVKLSSVVSEVLTNRLPIQKPHIIKRFGYDTFYIVRREQRKYLSLYEGLQSLALRLNHEVVLHENEIQRMIRLAYNLEGAMATVDAFPSLPQSVTSVPAMSGEDHTKMTSNIASVIAACEKISKRYKSLVRRSNETITNRLVVNEKSDTFGVIQLEKDFEILRVQLLKKVSTEKQHQEMMRSVKACGQRRDQLLRDKEMVQLLSVTGLVLEIEEIHKAREMGIQQAEKYQRDVQEMNKSYHSRLVNALAEETKPTHSEYLPNIVGIGDSLHKHMQNGTSHSLNPPKTMLQSYSDHTLESFGPQMSIISIAEEEAADALILKNQELRSKFESLIHSLTEEMNHF